MITLVLANSSPCAPAREIVGIYFKYLRFSLFFSRFWLFRVLKTISRKKFSLSFSL